MGASSSTSANKSKATFRKQKLSKTGWWRLHVIEKAARTRDGLIGIVLASPWTYARTPARMQLRPTHGNSERPNERTISGWQANPQSPRCAASVEGAQSEPVPGEFAARRGWALGWVFLSMLRWPLLACLLLCAP